MASGRPGRPDSERTFAGLRVHSVDDCSVQVTWEATAAEVVVVGAGDRRVEVPASPPARLWRRHLGSRRLSRLPGGPGGAVVDGLEPDRDHQLWVRPSTGERTSLATVRALPRPPGALLGQLATVNDVHVGERRFGAAGMIIEPADHGSPRTPSADRCLAAALVEARCWGAGHMVVKGDLTRDSKPAEFATVGRLLAGSGMAADVVLGNHDLRRGIDPTAILAPFGVDGRPEVRVRDLPGLRLVLAHTPLPDRRAGHLGDDTIDGVAVAAAAAPGACMVVLHHPPTVGTVTRQYPPGLPPASSHRLLRRLAAANPSTVVVAGHTHRNRVTSRSGVMVVETGSTKDYPGQWAGYRIFEGGLVQTARRITTPDAMAWTEATRHGIGGLWGLWSPGTLADRCWSRTWAHSR